MVSCSRSLLKKRGPRREAVDQLSVITKVQHVRVQVQMQVAGLVARDRRSPLLGEVFSPA